MFVFTAYTIEGGNDGFAALWLVTGICAVMLAVDFKAGFLVGVYYLLLLLLVFLGPLSFLLQYDYNATFMLRFPFLFAINFAFATYSYGVEIQNASFNLSELVKCADNKMIAYTEVYHANSSQRKRTGASSGAKRG